MMFKTHLITGLIVSLFLIEVLEPIRPIIFAITLTFGAILPDIDYPRSKVGRKFHFISRPLNLLFGHRGFMHTVYPPVLIFVGLLVIKQQLIGFAVLIGYILHLVIDSLTKEGVSVFSPLWNARIRGIVKTGGMIEYIIFLGLLIGLIFQILNML